MEFNERERRIIERLVHYNFIELNTLGKFLQEEILTVDAGLSTMCIKDLDKNVLYINTHIFNTDNELRRGLFIITEIFLLFLKLKKNGLIICIDGDDANAVLTAGLPNLKQSHENAMQVLIMENGDYIRNGDLEWCDSSGNIKYKAFAIEEKAIPIRQLMGAVIFISQELVSLVDRNFKSEEESRFIRELHWTRASFAVAFFGLLIATVSPFIFDTKLDDKQFDKIIENLRRDEVSIMKNEAERISMDSLCDKRWQLIGRVKNCN
jgi:hypothetical protein